MYARILLATLLGLAIRASAAEPTLELESPAPIELAPDVKTVRVLLKYGGTAAPATLNDPVPIDGVYLGGLQKDAAKFSVKWINKTGPFAIQLAVDLDQLHLAGTYDVLFEVQPGVRLKVQVLHPAPKLQTAQKLIIDRTYYFIGWSDSTHPRLSLHESSNKSKLTLSGIKPAGNTVLNAIPVGGTLNVTAEGKTIPPGGDMDLDYQTANDFGIGTATGTMRVDASELADTAGSFDFEVRSHVHWIYIGITIALALFISSYLKIYLQQRIELEQARVDAGKLLEQVRQEESRHADQQFQASYRAQARSLQTALSGKDPKAINDAKTALDQQWRSQLQALAKRHQEQLDDLNKLREVVDYDWPVPLVVAKQIGDARSKQANVRAAIEIDDLEEAARRYRQIVIDLSDQVAQSASLWQNAAAEVLKTLSTAEHGISLAVENSFSKPAQDAAGALHRIDPTVALDNPTKIQDALTSIRSERSSVIQVLDYLRDAIEKEWAAAQSAVTGQKPPGWNAGAFDQVGLVAREFAAFLQTIPDQPGAAEAVRQLQQMHEAWVTGLEKQTPGNPEVATALKANKYVDAVQAAIQARKQAAAAAAGHESFAVVRATEFAPPAYSPSVTSPPFPVYSIRTTFQTLFTPAPCLPTPVSNEAQLRRDKRLQSMILGMVLIIAGYGLQLNTFVGTFTDFSTLFFWAFGLDLTVDAVSKATKKG